MSTEHILLVKEKLSHFKENNFKLYKHLYIKKILIDFIFKLKLYNENKLFYQKIFFMKNIFQKKYFLGKIFSKFKLFSANKQSLKE